MDTVFSIEPLKIKFPLSKKIIKAKEYTGYLDAQDIIKRAKQKAKEIKEEAKQVYEDEKKRGFEEGMVEGKEEITQRIFDTAIKTVDYFEKSEDKIVDVVVMAIRKILEEFDDRKLVLEVVKKALQVVRNEKQVTVRVHPQEVDFLNENLAKIAKSSSSIGYIEVVGDMRVDKGGCLIESDLGIVDGNLEKQISILEKALKNSLGKKKKPAKAE